jgi:hypothetical protein
MMTNHLIHSLQTKGSLRPFEHAARANAAIIQHLTQTNKPCAAAL